MLRDHMKRPPVQARSVIITGCSSGIGLATARMLRDRGWTVVATARKAADLDMLRADRFDPVALDIADASSVAAAAPEALAKAGGVLGGLVNNAGFGQAGAVEDLSRDMLRQQFEVNLFGMQDFTNRLIPQLRRQGWGRIVNISSVLGRVTIPFNGAYSATKYAMESLSDALRMELSGSGIGVSIVEPGPIVTAFRRNAASRAQEALQGAETRYRSYYEHEIQRRLHQNKKPDLFTRPPEAVAEKIVHALESPRPRRRYCVTIPAHLGAFLARFAPAAVVDWAMSRRMARVDAARR